MDNVEVVEDYQNWVGVSSSQLLVKLQEPEEPIAYMRQV
jgi:hypothetical protein